MVKEHGSSIKDRDQYEKLGGKGESKGKRGRKPGSYEDWSKKDLQERAREIGIEGRSKMNKDTLIDALRQQEEQSPLKTEHGSIAIQDSVVYKIARIAAEEVDGVQMGGGGTSEAVGSVLSSVPGVASGTRSRGVWAEVGEDETAVDLTLRTEYGRAIHQVAEAVRNNVIRRVENLVGLRVTEVNITVSDIFFPQQEEEEQEQQLVWDRFSPSESTGNDAVDSWQRPMREADTMEGEERTDRTTEPEDELRVQRTEEELRAGTREREAGEVRVRKNVRTDRESVEVPTRREEVSVDRVPVEGEASESEIGEEEISVPLTEEEVVVEKRPVAKEEVRIRKDVVEETEVVEEDVRREEVDVDDQTNGPTR